MGVGRATPCATGLSSPLDWAIRREPMGRIAWHIPMVLIFLFDQSESLRLSMSPHGGGANEEKSLYNPAWDFQYVVDQAKTGQKLSFHCRVIYKRYEGRAETERLCDAWMEGLGLGGQGSP